MSANHITQRSSVRRTLTLLLCAALAALSLVACSSGGSSNGESTSSIAGSTSQQQPPANDDSSDSQTESDGGGTQPQTGVKDTEVVCSAHPAGTDVSPDVSIVAARAQKLASGATAKAQGTDQIVVDLPSFSGDISSLCTTARLDFRGLVAPAALITGSTPRSSTLNLGAAKVPLTEDQYEALSSTAKSTLATELASFNCASATNQTDNPNSYYVACDSTGQTAYLLGPVVVPGTEIDSATAVAPNVSQGLTQWTVALSLRSSGASAWANYTSAHNIGGADSSTADPTNCGPSTFPCADFVGFVLDGAVLELPVNISAINGGTTQVSGNFTEASAKKLALDLQTGALPINLSISQQSTVTH